MDPDRPEPTLQATATLHDTTYWLGHPDIVDAQVSEGSDDDEIKISFWLRPAALVGASEGAAKFTTAPSRPPDIELSGEGDVHERFWARCPQIEHMILNQDLPSEVHMDPWWLVRLWLISTVH